MELEALVENRIDTWLERRASKHSKVRYHAEESIANIQALPKTHPLHQELNKKAGETVQTATVLRMKGWEELRSACTGKSSQSGGRQITAESTGLDKIPGECNKSIIDEEGVAAEIKKECLRWSIYKFSVRYETTDGYRRLLNKVPEWPKLQQQEKDEVPSGLLSM